MGITPTAAGSRLPTRSSGYCYRHHAEGWLKLILTEPYAVAVLLVLIPSIARAQQAVRRPDPLIMALEVETASAANEETAHEPSGTLPEAEVTGEWMPVDAGAGLGDSTLAAGSASEPVELLETREAGRGGRWRITPHLLALATYDDNIFIQTNNRVHDYIFTLAPGIAFGFWDADDERERFLERQGFGTVLEKSRGNMLVVDYTAILQKFVRTDSEDSLDHNALLEARWRGEKLTLGASAHLESKTETNTDIGGRIRRKASAAAVTSRYEVTEKTTLGLEIHNVVNDPEGFIRTIETLGEGSIDYAATPMTRLGVGVAVGTTQPDVGADQVFQRVLARAEYSLTDKVEASFRGGAEFRQFDGAGQDRVNPVFALRVGWRPAADTEFALDGFRRVETSAAEREEDYTVTGFGVSFRRELRPGLHLSLQGGYQISRYTTASSDGSRTDHYFSIRPGLFYSITPWAGAGVSYEHRRNDSDRPGSTFKNNQTTFQLGLRY